MGGSHTFLAKFVHWFFVILYAYGIFKQLDDLEQLEDSGLLMFEVVFASVFLLIVLIRYFYMSRFETFLGANEPVPLIHTYLAKTVHRLMYFCLVLLPLTGLAIAALFRRGMVDGLLMDRCHWSARFCCRFELSTDRCSCSCCGLLSIEKRGHMDFNGATVERGRNKKIRFSGENHRLRRQRASKGGGIASRKKQ